ncbi:hypothetical protein BKA66DRAFT_247383 [Pyrenochaeta sp. MPI-SDFR-AT-0127]|nr:hypothetical protein BKA66DRAFT_247383 [Pyrenochaeta sp. MPI-SDFR-AT-0127]
MVCRLAGKPVPQRTAPSIQRPADERLEGSQIGSAPQPPAPRKLSTEEHLAPSLDKCTVLHDGTSGKATGAIADDQSVVLQAQLPTSNKRVAFPDSAKLNEDEDGRAKRARLDGAVEAPISIVAKDGICSSCLDIHPKHTMLQLPCKDDGDMETHAYCRDCLNRLFESSVTDPSHFPPRCCSRILPLSSCMPFLPQDLISRFVGRREELETPNRTYCSSTECSKWIKPAHIIGGVATCAVCSQKTCSTCKSKQHDGLCPEDKDVKELMKVARQKRWQTCPKCKEMVELERGCNHITCRCRYEFCYVCVANWRTCKCPVWDERSIIDPIPAANNAAQPIANGVVPFRGFMQHQAGQVQGQLQNAAPVANNANGKRRGNRRKRRNNQAHEHTFERYYRSQGWNTECHQCGNKDRWVNCCTNCDLAVCWYCTKYRMGKKEDGGG